MLRKFFTSTPPKSPEEPKLPRDYECVDVEDFVLVDYSSPNSGVVNGPVVNSPPVRKTYAQAASQPPRTTKVM